MPCPPLKKHSTAARVTMGSLEAMSALFGAVPFRLGRFTPSRSDHLKRAWLVDDSILRGIYLHILKGLKSQLLAFGGSHVYFLNALKVDSRSPQTCQLYGFGELMACEKCKKTEIMHIGAIGSL